MDSAAQARESAYQAVLSPKAGIRLGLQAPAAEVPQDECRPVDAPRRESSRTKGPD